MLEVSMKNKYIKTLFLTILLLAVVMAGYLVAAKRYDIWPFTPVVQRSPTTTNASVPTGSTVEKSDVAQAGSDPSPVPVPSDEGGKPTVGLILSSANKNDPNLQVRVIIQAVTATGECVLALKNQSSGTVKTYSSGVQPLSSTSTCKGFDIPLTDLSLGVWTLTLHFENESIRGDVHKDITI